MGVLERIQVTHKLGQNIGSPTSRKLGSGGSPSKRAGPELGQNKGYQKPPPCTSSTSESYRTTPRSIVPRRTTPHTILGRITLKRISSPRIESWGVVPRSVVLGGGGSVYLYLLFGRVGSGGGGFCVVFEFGLQLLLILDHRLVHLFVGG